MYNKNNLKNELNGLADEKYKQFSSKMGMGKLNILGIRVPKLRTLAKELANSNWQEFFVHENNWCSEIIVLKGLVIGYAKIDIDTFENFLLKFFDMVESWMETDICASNFKIINKNRQQIFEFIKPYLFCNQEYKTRLAIIILLDYFLINEYIDSVLKILPKIEHGDYYVDMAVAWLLSVCFVKFREKTLDLLKQKKFSRFVQNKAIQKCCESFRVSTKDKELLKEFKI